MSEEVMFSADSGAIVVAHELKAPLALLRQQALSLEFEDSLAGARQVGREMVAVTDRALRQAEDLVRITRLEDALFAMEPVNPRVVCDEVVLELWQMFKFNRREVAVRYKNRQRLVVANRKLLYSVIYNFCLNAMNYGGEDLPSQIVISDRQGLWVRVEVRDFGPTVPTKVWREIKGGFVKRPVEMAMRPGSSGLGLYIASQFIRHMRGKFGLVRHRDGTSFYVDLPVSRQTSLL